MVINTQGFVHLHLHSEYSLFDSTIKFPGLFARLKELGMDTVALTDHGNMFGACEFYRCAKCAGIKPIIGCELYVASFSDTTSYTRETYHLTVLVMNDEGYGNLTRLVSLSQYNKINTLPTVQYNSLVSHSKGLIVLSGCLEGELARAIIDKNFERAINIAKSFRNIFGDRYYLEIQATGLEVQHTVNNKIMEIGNSLGIELVATNDCHYLKRLDAIKYKVRHSVGNVMPTHLAKTLQENNEYFLKSEEEMLVDLKGFENAVSQTKIIAGRCNYVFATNSHKVPKIDHYGDIPVIDNFEVVLHLKLQEKVSQNMINDEYMQIYLERLEKETQIIKKMNLSDYFMIVGDCVEYVRLNKRLIGPGYGALSGSLVAYLLGITELDPIKNKLFFERYLNPNMPARHNINLVLSLDSVAHVIEFLKNKYGDERVCSIGYKHIISAVEALERARKLFKASFEEIEVILNLLPQGESEAHPVYYPLYVLCSGPRVRKLINKSPLLKAITSTAQEIEGVVKDVAIVRSVLCSVGDDNVQGVAILSERISDRIPLYQYSDNEVLTQYDSDDLDELQCRKILFVGSQVLTVMQKAMTIIIGSSTITNNTDFDISKIPLDDQLVYERISSGDTEGIFENASKNMRKYLRRLSPSNLEDLTSFIALYWPGPIDSGLMNEFIARKRNKKKIEYPHTELTEILECTYGLFIYQEQIMETVYKIADYNMIEADLLRRSLGKKMREEIQAHKLKFIEGTRNNMIDELSANIIFDLMAENSVHCYSRAHALATALMAYRATYIKLYYPKEFSTAYSYYGLDKYGH